MLVKMKLSSQSLVMKCVLKQSFKNKKQNTCHRQKTHMFVYNKTLNSFRGQKLFSSLISRIFQFFFSSISSSAIENVNPKPVHPKVLFIFFKLEQNTRNAVKL